MCKTITICISNCVSNTIYDLIMHESKKFLLHEKPTVSCNQSYTNYLLHDFSFLTQLCDNIIIENLEISSFYGTYPTKYLHIVRKVHLLEISWHDNALF